MHEKVGKKRQFIVFLIFFPASDPIDEIVTVEGHAIQLPCDITPPNPLEQVYLVLWYRQDEGEPIYRCASLFFLICISQLNGSISHVVVVKILLTVLFSSGQTLKKMSV